MPYSHLSDKEVALDLARRVRAWRSNPRGAGMTQEELVRRSGVGLTPLKRFEKTGGATLNNLIGMLRAMGLLDRLEDLIPEPSTPTPLELLQASLENPPRRRAPRRKKAAVRGRPRRHG